VALTVERWFQPINDDMVSVDNYVLHCCNRLNHKDDGIAGYVRCGIDSKIFNPSTTV